MLGGGKAMMNAYYDTAAKLGVEIAYETEVRELKMTDGQFASAVASRDGASKEYAAKTLVVASGGFEANIPWLKEYWGDAADNFIIRGTPHNQGGMLKELLRHGAKPEGDPRGCHAVALDARAPKFDGGIVTRLDSVPFGIVVNKKVKRFYDEGEDFWPKRYAIWGKTHRRTTGADRLLDHRLQRIAALHAVGISAGGSSVDRRAGHGVGNRSARALRRRRRIQSLGAWRQIRSRQFGRVPYRRTSIRRKATGPGRSIRRRTTAIRCGRGSRLLISALP